MPAESHEHVAIERRERALLGLGEAHVRARRGWIGEEARAEVGIGLDRVEAAVEPVGAGRRKRIVELLAHTGHSTTALSWCQEGS